MKESKIRTAIINFAARCPFISDKSYLKLRFRLEMNRKLNLSNPRTFQEKIQWLKLYNRKPEYTVMVDKYAVKDYVENLIGPQYITPTIGVWDTPDAINFDELPKQFVLKTTHGGGNTGVVVCKDKDLFDKQKAIYKLKRSLKSDIYLHFREWPYKNVPRRIIAEEYIGDGADVMTDYKIFCFGGEPLYIQVIKDRDTQETIDFFDKDWNHQEFWGLNPKTCQATTKIDRPDGLNEMLNAARILAKDMPFVRVDFYQLDNEIRFGEITFYPASGFGTFTPCEWNDKFGELINIRTKSK